jgi:hypothetical protein
MARPAVARDRGLDPGASGRARVRRSVPAEALRICRVARANDRETARPACLKVRHLVDLGDRPQIVRGATAHRRIAARVHGTRARARRHRVGAAGRARHSEALVPPAIALVAPTAGVRMGDGRGDRMGREPTRRGPRAPEVPVTPSPIGGRQVRARRVRTHRVRAHRVRAPTAHARTTRANPVHRVRDRPFGRPPTVSHGRRRPPSSRPTPSAPMRSSSRGAAPSRRYSPRAASPTVCSSSRSAGPRSNSSSCTPRDFASRSSRWKAAR